MGDLQTPILKRLLTIQLCIIFLTCVALFFSMTYLAEQNHTQLLQQEIERISPILNERQETWRAWAMLGLSEALDREFSSVKKTYPISSLRILGTDDSIADPHTCHLYPKEAPLEDSLSHRLEVCYDVAAIRAHGSVMPLLFNFALFLFLFLLTFTVFSFRYIYKNIYKPLRQLRLSFSNVKSGGELNTSGISAQGEIKDFLIEISRLWSTNSSLQRSAAIGEIARQIAHDIRSPLTAIDMIIKSTPEITGEKAELLKNAIERIKNIASDLLKKGRSPGPAEPQPIPVASLIASALKEYEVKHENEHPRTVVSIENSLPDDFKYNGNKHDLARVLSNLINNAHDAIQQVSLPQIKVSSQLSNDQLLILIADNGVGIPPDVLARIGEKGLTLGKGERGNGLGVHHAFEVIHRHGGDLNFQSQVGRGTTVTITLPLRFSP